MSVTIEEYLENITVSVEEITDDITVQVSVSSEGGSSSTVIADNLTTASPLAALSANQGVVLKGFINNINTLLSSDDTTLDELQEIVNFIKQNKTTLDTLGISNISGLVEALAGKVNNSQVLTNVPLNALFTDTIYNDALLDQRVTGLETSIGDINSALDTINGTVI